MRAMPDNSVDLIATDPPYFRVKNEEWDRQWESPDKFIAWIGELAEQWQRVLRPNGSLYCFASPRMAARVEVEIGRRFEMLNRVRWQKSAGWHNKVRPTDLRSFLSPWEEIIFAEHFSADNMAKGEAGYVAKCDELRGFVFEPLRAYLDGERKRAGIDKADCNVACGFSHSAGGMASRHYFSSSQWCLPTAEHYAALQRLFNAKGDEYLRRDYEELRRDYEYLRRDYEELRVEYEELRRPFTVSASVPYTDVWDFPTVQAYRGKHVCEKPVALMEHIIAASSRPGAVVLDCFAGSASTGVAALRLGREFIGIEKDEAWVRRGRERLDMEGAGLFGALECFPRALLEDVL